MNVSQVFYHEFRILKILYQDAVKNNQGTVIYNNQEYDINYLKYLIQYLESKFKINK